MTDSIGIIGGADGPTAVLVAGSVGSGILRYFAVLLVILAAAIYFAKSRKLYRFFAVMGGAWVVIIDQWVKLLVSWTMALGETAALLPPLVRLRRVHNYGAAWSSFSGARWLLIGVTAVGLGVLVWLLAKIVRHPLGVWSLTLVIAGGIGNLIDRVRVGYVVDMFEFMFTSFPVFNVADIFVTCGTVAAAIYYFVCYEKYDAKNFKGKTDESDTPDNADA